MQLTNVESGGRQHAQDASFLLDPTINFDYMHEIKTNATPSHHKLKLAATGQIFLVALLSTITGCNQAIPNPCKESVAHIENLDKKMPNGKTARERLAHIGERQMIRFNKSRDLEEKGITVSPDSHRTEASISVKYEMGNIRFISSERVSGSGGVDVPLACTDKVEIDVTTYLESKDGAFMDSFASVLTSSSDNEEVSVRVDASIPRQLRGSFNISTSVNAFLGSTWSHGKIKSGQIKAVFVENPKQAPGENPQFEDGGEIYTFSEL